MPYIIICLVSLVVVLVVLFVVLKWMFGLKGRPPYLEGQPICGDCGRYMVFDDEEWVCMQCAVKRG